MKQPVQFNIGKFRILWINQLLLFGAFENVNYSSASAAYLLSNGGIAEALLVKCQYSIIRSANCNNKLDTPW